MVGHAVKKPYFFVATLITAAIILPIGLWVATSVPGSEKFIKSYLATQVKQASGLELQIDGNVVLSFFPALSFSIENIKLRNPPGFAAENLLQADNIRLGLKWLPLLAKRLEIVQLEISGIKLNLARNAQGQRNWQPILSRQNANDGQSGPTLAGISGIRVKQAGIDWLDEVKGQHIQATALDFTSGEVKSSQPFTWVLKLTAVNALNPNRLIDFALRSTQTRVDLESRSVKMPEIQLNLANLTLSGAMAFDFRQEDFLLAGKVSAPVFNPSELAGFLGVALTSLSDPDALTKMAFNFDFSAMANRVSLENLNINLDDSKISGSMKADQFQPLVAELDLTVDHVDFDRYRLKQQPASEQPLTAPAVALAEILLPAKALNTLILQGGVSIAQLKSQALVLNQVVLNFESANSSRSNINQVLQRP
ncbi:MAG: hypothetical protein CTY24_08420 [Methylobacter sp.]|nr:MAG: hypothetical protein CTY24_08420 [Methylobacter sp.]